MERCLNFSYKKQTNNVILSSEQWSLFENLRLGAVIEPTQSIKDLILDKIKSKYNMEEFDKGFVLKIKGASSKTGTPLLPHVTCNHPVKVYNKKLGKKVRRLPNLLTHDLSQVNAQLLLSP